MYGFKHERVGHSKRFSNWKYINVIEVLSYTKGKFLKYYGF